MSMGHLSHKIKCKSHKLRCVSQKSGFGIYFIEIKCKGRLLSKNNDE